MLRISSNARLFMKSCKFVLTNLQKTKQFTIQYGAHRDSKLTTWITSRKAAKCLSCQNCPCIILAFLREGRSMVWLSVRTTKHTIKNFFLIEAKLPSNLKTRLVMSSGLGIKTLKVPSKKSPTILRDYGCRIISTHGST